MEELGYFRRKNAPPAPELLDTPTITITVNASAEHTWNIHKRLLCRYSSYFTGALGSDVQEGKTQHVELEDEEPSIVRLMYYWLYSGSIDVDNSADSQETLVTLWVFADRRGMPALQNHCLDALQKSLISSECFDNTIIWPLFEDTLRQAPIREWCAHVFFLFGNSDFLDDQRPDEDSYSDYPSDFLYRLSWMLLKSRGKPLADFKTTLENLDTCQYHVHEKDKRCGILSEMDQKERQPVALVNSEQVVNGMLKQGWQV